MDRLSTFLFFCLFSLYITGNAQSHTVPGEVIANYGNTYPIENPDFTTALASEYKVVFDISKAPADPSQLNKTIETVARFLNMHHEAGKPLNTMKVFMVFHGEASYSLLQDPYYKDHYNTTNPNLELLKALANKDVTILLCGQTAIHRNLLEDKRIPETKIALSAMTALIQLQQDGYALINF